jgi:hypothetical protein
MSRDAAVASLNRLQTHLESILRIVTDRRGLSNLALIDNLASTLAPSNIDLDWINIKQANKFNEHSAIEMTKPIEIDTDSTLEEKLEEKLYADEYDKKTPTDEPKISGSLVEIPLIDKNASGANGKSQKTTAKENSPIDKTSFIQEKTVADLKNNNDKNDTDGETSSIIDNIKSAILRITNTILNKVKEILSTITTAAADVWEKITNFIHSCYQYIRSLW